MVKDKQLLKNYNKMRKKNEKLMSIDSDSKPTYGDDDKYVKTKIKIYEDSITTNVFNKTGSKKTPEEKVPCNCLLNIKDLHCKYFHNHHFFKL